MESRGGWRGITRSTSFYVAELEALQMHVKMLLSGGENHPGESQSCSVSNLVKDKDPCVASSSMPTLRVSLCSTEPEDRRVAEFLPSKRLNLRLVIGSAEHAPSVMGKFPGSICRPVRNYGAQPVDPLGPTPMLGM